ncbi:MAG: long-chain acyl-CoA synthetase [Nitriliruptoraceae bacterium]|jgi:long-chain acyl-CoA synthetase
MQEYTMPGEVNVPATETLTTSIFEAYEQHPTRPAFATRVGGAFQTISTKAFVDDVVATASGLMGLGIKAGDRVCIMSPTRYEWTVVDYAIWAAGAVTVPIYETSSAEQVEWIVGNSEAVAIIVADAELKTIFDDVADRLPACAHVFVLDDGGLDTLRAAGDSDHATVRARSETRTGSDLATLVYTSGTTGRPKGVELSHTNFVWDATQVVNIAGEFFRAGESTLLFLPLAHIFARLIQVGSVRSGVLLAYSTGIPALLEELQMLKPTFLLAVPRVFEKVFNGAQQRSHADGKGKIFDKAAATAIAYSEAQTSGATIGLKLKLEHALFDKLVYSKLRTAMGGRIRFAVSGGAALGTRLGHFYNGIGITILEGYGLTETSAGATLNAPSAFRIGSVGRPLPGASVKIAEDGEVLIKSGGVLKGYFKNDAATKEAITEDGWFCSGDLGSIDSEGYLSITGRKKEIIVTAGGKNVAPAPLEDRIRAHNLISQAMVIGDDRKFVSAVLTLDPDAFPVWAAANGKAGKTVADLVDDAELHAELQKAVDDANKSVSKAESIRAFKILPVDFEIGDELSQKQSVKRHVVNKKYSDVIESIYS